jgi:hypothetical protein
MGVCVMEILVEYHVIRQAKPKLLPVLTKQQGRSRAFAVTAHED